MYGCDPGKLTIDQWFDAIVHLWDFDNLAKPRSQQEALAEMAKNKAQAMEEKRKAKRMVQP